MLLNREQREQLRQLGSMSTIGLEIAIYVAGGLLGGQWLDEKLGSAPWFQWIGLALGLAAATRSLYRLVRRAQKMMKNEEDNPNGNDSNSDKT